MEPTPGEYPSKMRVALVRRNPADGAAPLGLEVSGHPQPYPSRYSLSHPPLASHPEPPPGSKATTARPPAGQDRRRRQPGPHAADPARCLLSRPPRRRAGPAWKPLSWPAAAPARPPVPCPEAPPAGVPTPAEVGAAAEGAKASS